MIRSLVFTTQGRLHSKDIDIFATYGYFRKKKWF